MMGAVMTKIQQVRKEYGESFAGVVKGFAEQGNSRTLTAATLVISLSHFRDICTRFNLHQYFRPQSEMMAECKSGRKRGRNQKGYKASQKYSDDQVLAEVRKYMVSTTFESLSNISMRTVRRRFGSWKAARELAMKTESNILAKSR